MARLHLFEIHEQPWCPAGIRDGSTEFLERMAMLMNFYGPLEARLLGAVRRSGASQVLDLCSGSGGPWLALRRSKKESGPWPDLRLTDLFPHEESRDKMGLATEEGVTYERRPVDALEVPSELTGFRTFFTAFHHFRPPQAAAILRSAVDSGQGIGLMEPSRRHPLTMLSICTFPVLQLLLAPFLRPLRGWRFFWTYLVPAIPLVLLFDGLVSCLRTYSPSEMRELIAEADPLQAFEWEVGTERMGYLPLRVTYLFGVPAN